MGAIGLLGVALHNVQRIADGNLAATEDLNAAIIASKQCVSRVTKIAMRCRRFGSVKGLRGADPTEIAAAVGPSTARAVADYLGREGARSA